MSIVIAQPPSVLDSPILGGSNQLIGHKSAERRSQRDALFFPVYSKKLDEIYDMADKRRHALSTLPNVENLIIVEPKDGEKKIVNVCSNTYNLKPLSEILLPIEEILDKHFDYSASYRHNEHCRFFVDYVVHKPDTMQDSTDIILPKIRIQHSYSGDVRYEIKYGFWRQICSNGLTVMVDGATVRAKHTTNKLKLGTNVEGLLEFVDKASDFKRQYEVLGDRAVLDFGERVLEVISATNFPKGLKDMVLDRITYENGFLGLPATDWLVYNGFNYILNHNHSELMMQEWNRQTLDKNILNYLLN